MCLIFPGVLAIGLGPSGKLSFLNDGNAITDANYLPNPSYLCILERSTNSTRPSALLDGGLCIVSELDKGKMQPFALRFEGMNNIHASAVGKAVDAGGSYPCHIISSNVRGMESIIVCNYGETQGVLSMFASDKLGDHYTQQVCIPFGPGSNVDTDRQGTSHAHSTFITTSPSSSDIIALCCDLGSDAIIQFTLTTKSNTDGEVSLQCVEKDRLSAPPGSGPRSLSMNPVYDNIAVVSLEMTAQVWLIQRKDDGSFEGLVDPVSLLPENWPEDSSSKEKQYNNGKWASDAIWSPDGKFMYASARLHNSISVFEVQLSGTSSESVKVEGLKLIQRIPTGLTPRCLCMSDCGDHILVANQHSHEIQSFQRSKNDGKITFIDRLEVPNAACVKLVHPELIGQSVGV